MKNKFNALDSNETVGNKSLIHIPQHEDRIFYFLIQKSNIQKKEN